MTRRFVGIDFSTTSTGIAIFDRNGLQTHTVKSKPVMGGLAGYYARVRDLSVNVLAVVQPEPDDVIAIESPIVMGRRTDTEIKLHYAWHRFMECYHAWHPDLVAPSQFAPSEVKQMALGREKRLTGKAGKKQMVKAVGEHFEGHALRNDDEADAVWIAVGASILAGSPVIDLPAAHMPKALMKG